MKDGELKEHWEDIREDRLLTKGDVGWVKGVGVRDLHDNESNGTRTDRSKTDEDLAGVVGLVLGRRSTMNLDTLTASFTLVETGREWN